MFEKLFFPYPEIENSYQEGFIAKIKEAGFSEIPYAVMEKIHGGNSQITYNINTGEFFYGTRQHILEENESFYNLQAIFDNMQSDVKVLAKHLQNDVQSYGQKLISVTVYGEVFGGSYPHDSVTKDRNAMRVQKGVFYSPSNQWLAFDVAYTIEGSERLFFLPVMFAVRACMLAGIDFVPVLHIANNLDEALAYPNDKSSEVYCKYDLPKIEDNIMEGVVIRPYRENAWVGVHRVILKNKNSKFKEKSRVKKDTISEEIPENVKKACEEVSQYITINRVHNVLSHLGEVNAKDIGKIIMETSKDVLADYNKEYDTLSKLEKKEEKIVTKYMNGEVAKVVRDVVLFGK